MSFNAKNNDYEEIIGVDENMYRSYNKSVTLDNKIKVSGNLSFNGHDGYEKHGNEILLEVIEKNKSRIKELELLVKFYEGILM